MIPHNIHGSREANQWSYMAITLSKSIENIIQSRAIGTATIQVDSFNDAKEFLELAQPPAQHSSSYDIIASMNAHRVAESAFTLTEADEHQTPEDISARLHKYLIALKRLRTPGPLTQSDVELLIPLQKFFRQLYLNSLRVSTPFNVATLA